MIKALYPKDLGLPAGWTPTVKEEATYGAQWKRAVAFHTDVIETSSRRRTVDAWGAANGTACSAIINILTPDDAARLGSHHSVELDYVFNNVNHQNQALQNMAKLMSRVWASFVMHLDPNFHQCK